MQTTPPHSHSSATHTPVRCTITGTCASIRLRRTWMTPRVRASLACLMTACLVIAVYSISGVLISTPTDGAVVNNTTSIKGNATILIEGAVFPKSATPDLDKTELGVGRLIGNYIVVFLSGCLAAAAGVGGGAIYTPLYIVLFDLLYEAVPLSKAAVLGCAIAFFIGNMSGKHARHLTFRHSFAYDVIMVMEPATLLGTLYGVLLSHVFPYWLITLMMTSMLTIAARKTLKKANNLHARETEDYRLSGVLLRNDRERGNSGSDASSGGHWNGDHGTIIPTSSANEFAYGTIGQDADDDVAINNAMRAAMYLREHKSSGYAAWMGWRCIISVSVSYVAIVLHSLSIDDALTTSTGFGFACGSIGYWAANLTAACVCLIATMSNVKYLLGRREFYGNLQNMQRNSYGPGVSPSLDDSIIVDESVTVEWTRNKCIKYVVLCFVAGVLSSLVGIGGSTIKGPILLHMGLDASLAKATAQLMLLSTVSISVLQFLFNGMLPPWYGLSFFICGGCSGVVGKYVVDRYVHRRGRQSIIIYLLAFYIMVATVIMTMVGVILVFGELYGPTKDNYAHRWEQLSFRDMCASIPPDMGALKWFFE